MKDRNNRKAKKLKTPYSLASNYRYIYKNMWNYSKSLIFYGLAEILFKVITPLGNVIIPSIVVGFLVKQVPISRFALVLIAVFLIYGVIVGINEFLFSRNNTQYIDFRFDFILLLCNKCLHMDYQLLEKEQVRQNLEKAMNSLKGNFRGVEGFMHANVRLLSNIFGLILYACIISTAHPLILLLLLIISLIQTFSFNRAKEFEHKKKDEMAEYEVTQRYLQDQAFDLKAGKDIRLYQLNHLIYKVYSDVNYKLKKVKTRIRSFYYLNDVVGIVLRFLRDALCYGYLIYLLMHGLEVSYFVLYLGVISGFATWFTKITEDCSVIARSHLAISDFRTFIDTKDVFHHQGGKVLDDKDMALDIVFDHVSFRYEGADKDVLKDVSFHIKKGEKLALVGINGAGKTTLVKLMCGFYQPTKGRILINGIDIKELNIVKYFEQIAVVFQDAFTTSFTIGENITCLPRGQYDKRKLEKVLKLSGLISKIRLLDKGMDTYLNKDMDENGIQLSGGELQKLMLARALYKEAKLLILDEPTAALDAMAESELYENYQKLLEGRTSIFISHRLASTRFCDYILYLEDGSIKEEGTHDELMNMKGNYANMFHVQSKYYVEEEAYEVQENLA